MVKPRLPRPGVQRARSKASRQLGLLKVDLLPGARYRGRIVAGSHVVPCVLGPGGITRRKREGDGATPAGRFALLGLLFRPDRGPPPRSGLRAKPLRRMDGWCDDPGHACYNKPVARPFRGSHEAMWRDDHLYDAVVVIDHNLRPVRKGRGSAIFLHVQASPPRPTAGCIAVEPVSLRRLLARLGPRTRLQIR